MDSSKSTADSNQTIKLIIFKKDGAFDQFQPLIHFQDMPICRKDAVFYFSIPLRHLASADLLNFLLDF
ncbi:hypothetical protein SUBVAR_06565 [Subdoligranulum variabile DSM 15176]|uniref:Uncharacterized protein n=1 Tax=Subdoligranulum variabile DSM 15176 TaxID=411471 RepID=D1PQ97_9FIRM|nr:hypothetical protein SUBVAR_06565 [Subdoligranulum variabile DSM 15176]